MERDKNFKWLTKILNKGHKNFYDLLMKIFFKKI